MCTAHPAIVVMNVLRNADNHDWNYGGCLHYNPSITPTTTWEGMEHRGLHHTPIVHLFYNIHVTFLEGENQMWIIMDGTQQEAIVLTPPGDYPQAYIHQAYQELQLCLSKEFECDLSLEFPLHIHHCPVGSALVCLLFRCLLNRLPTEPKDLIEFQQLQEKMGEVKVFPEYDGNHVPLGVVMDDRSLRGEFRMQKNVMKDFRAAAKEFWKRYCHWIEFDLRTSLEFVEAFPADLSNRGDIDVPFIDEEFKSTHHYVSIQEARRGDQLAANDGWQNAVVTELAYTKSPLPIVHYDPKIQLILPERTPIFLSAWRTAQVPDVWIYSPANGGKWLTPAQIIVQRGFWSVHAETISFIRPL